MMLFDRSGRQVLGSPPRYWQRGPELPAGVCWGTPEPQLYYDRAVATPPDSPYGSLPCFGEGSPGSRAACFPLPPLQKRSDAAEAAAVEADLDFLATLAAGHRWALLHPLQPEEPRRPASEAAAVLVPTCSALWERSARQLDHLRKASQHQVLPPVVAVAVGSRSQIQGEVEFLRRQAEAHGLDLVMFCLGSRQEMAAMLPLQVAALARAHARCQELEKERRALERRLTVKRNQAAMFWQCAHTFQALEKVLPPLDRSLPPGAEEGSEVRGLAVEKYLNRGSTGVVHLARNKETGEQVVMKFMEKDRFQHFGHVRQAAQELKIHARLGPHVNIARFVGSFHSPTDLILCTEFAGTRNLYQAVRDDGGLAADGCQIYSQQLMAALGHCHAQGVAHRDLKLENLVLSADGAQLQLIDFGLAVSTKKCRQQASVCGSVPYIAPEVVVASDSSPYDPLKADVWSAGVVVFEMLCGVTLFEDLLRAMKPGSAFKDRAEAVRRLFEERPTLLQDLARERRSDVDVVVLDFFARTAVFEPATRASSEELSSQCLWLQVLCSKAGPPGDASTSAEDRGALHK